MPTYAYACTACEHRFEIVQSFTDDSLTECPECAGRLRKLFNAVGVVFKGSGFYRNDSRNDSRSGAGHSSRNGSAGSGGSGHSGKNDHGGSGSTSAPAASGDSGGSSADSSSSTAAASAGNAGTTKTAAKRASKSEGAAA